MLRLLAAAQKAATIIYFANALPAIMLAFLFDCIQLSSLTSHIEPKEYTKYVHMYAYACNRKKEPWQKCIYSRSGCLAKSIESGASVSLRKVADLRYFMS